MTTIHDDDDDLESLRLAALASMHAKQKAKMPQPMSVPYQKHNRRNNLLVLTASEPSLERSWNNNNKSNGSNKMVVETSRPKKTISKTGISRFDRIKDDDSESDSEDEDLIAKSIVPKSQPQSDISSTKIEVSNIKDIPVVKTPSPEDVSDVKTTNMNQSIDCDEHEDDLLDYNFSDEDNFDFDKSPSNKFDDNDNAVDICDDKSESDKSDVSQQEQEFAEDLILLDDTTDLLLDSESNAPSRRQSRCLSSVSVQEVTRVASPPRVQLRKRVLSEEEEGEVKETYRRPKSTSPSAVRHRSRSPTRPRRRRSSSPKPKKKKSSPERRKKEKSKKSKKKKSGEGNDDLRYFLNKRRNAAIESVQASVPQSLNSVVSVVVSQKSVLERLGSKSSN